MAHVPLRASRLATNAMRRTFVSRSSFENPRPFERFSRTSSPSSTSTRTPLSRKAEATFSASVLLPAPERPVNHRMKPRSFMCASADLAFEVRHLEALLVHDRTVAEVPGFAEQLAVVGRDDHVRVLRHEVPQL